jgi:hypothetical protein
MGYIWREYSREVEKKKYKIKYNKAHVEQNGG